MERERVSFTVQVDLDPTPGAFHSAAGARMALLDILTQRIPYYNPEVSREGFVSSQMRYADKAMFITEKSVRPGGEFFMQNEAVVGWWCVRSEDPIKRDLFLPPHIFHKCFRGAEPQVDEDWSEVQEII